MFLGMKYGEMSWGMWRMRGDYSPHHCVGFFFLFCIIPLPPPPPPPPLCHTASCHTHTHIFVTHIFVTHTIFHAHTHTHLSIFVLCGRRGTYGSGWLWWRAWSPLVARGAASTLRPLIDDWREAQQKFLSNVRTLKGNWCLPINYGERSNKRNYFWAGKSIFRANQYHNVGTQCQTWPTRLWFWTG